MYKRFSIHDGRSTGTLHKINFFLILCAVPVDGNIVFENVCTLNKITIILVYDLLNCLSKYSVGDSDYGEIEFI